ncbi:MAG: ATP-binding protein [Symploca sp. SIO1C2]|nr:ATP-binding protein [Symploca sp. SIO1C2]
MKIQKIEYQDQEYEWKIETLELLPNLTLLVGGSGAGKTQILQSIFKLKEIGNGESFNGVKWDICFLTENNVNYRWKGEFETQKTDEPFLDQTNREEHEFDIVEEFLYRDDQPIIERNSEEIFFEGYGKTPKLSPSQSVIELFQQEEDIEPAKKNLDKIILSKPYKAIEKTDLVVLAISKTDEKYSLNDIQNSDFSVPVKLLLAHRYLPEIFEEIKNNFIKIFPQAEDIRLQPFLDLLGSPLVSIEIKEKGVDHWISHADISLGMRKTLIHLSELFLTPEGSVILIDEFENSLGVNCIDSVTDLILENKNLQFIITSHHPYIINNISPEFWKIVFRKGGSISTKNPEEFHISKSRQRAFIDLINVLEDYYDTLEVE